LLEWLTIHMCNYMAVVVVLFTTIKQNLNQCMDKQTTNTTLSDKDKLLMHVTTCLNFQSITVKWAKSGSKGHLLCDILGGKKRTPHQWLSRDSCRDEVNYKEAQRNFEGKGAVPLLDCKVTWPNTFVKAQKWAQKGEL
jgi:hypothetical protein